MPVYAGFVARGPAGAAGATGSQGPAGADGAQGPQGETGPAGTGPVNATFVRRFSIPGTKAVAGATTTIILGAKPATEIPLEVRVKWGPTKWNLPTSTCYVSVGRTADTDGFLLARDIGSVAAGGDCQPSYYNNLGADLAEGGYTHKSHLLHHGFGTAEDYVITAQLGAGSSPTTGTLEISILCADMSTLTTVT